MNTQKKGLLLLFLFALFATTIALNGCGSGGGSSDHTVWYDGGGTGAPVALVFSQQPQNSIINTPVTPAVTVDVVDSQGNVVTSATNTITIAQGTHPDGSTLGGTVTVAAAGGRATFSDLTLDTFGQYTLTAAADGLTGATSSTFMVGALGPAILVDTASFTETTDSGQTIPRTINVTNVGTENLVIGTSTRGEARQGMTVQKKESVMQKIQQGLRTLSSVETADRAPMLSSGRGVLQGGVRALWDLLFSYDVQTGSGDQYCVGTEFDGTNFYVSGGMGGAATPAIHIFDCTGAYISSFDEPGATSGDWGMRDLAWDGHYLYGSYDTNIIQFDTAGNQAGTITGPGINPCRAIAYDPATGHFWVADWHSDIYEIDRTGAIIHQFTTPTETDDKYGFAWDAVSSGGPYLWIFDQSGPDPYQTFYQFSPALGAYTGVSYFLPGAVMENRMAGGAFLTTTWDPAKIILGGLDQAPEDFVFGLELGDYAGWCQVTAPTTTVAPGQTVPVNVTFDAHGLYGITYNRDIVITSNDPAHPEVVIPAQLDVNYY